MNTIGNDASKVKSMIEVMHPGKEVAIEPFEASHIDSEQIDMARGNPKLGRWDLVVIESTDNCLFLLPGWSITLAFMLS